MSSPAPDDLTSRPRILVADEDPKVVAFIIETLRKDGLAVFHAYDMLSATELAYALDKVHLVITNTRVSGSPGTEFVNLLRTRLPTLPIMYIANIDRSTPAIEARLPRNVPILREPFTAEQLRELVTSLLEGEPDLLDLGR
jgi:DNA-binding NtrC family response regulator